MAYRNTFFRWLFLYSLTFGLTYVLKLFTYLCPETGHFLEIIVTMRGPWGVSSNCLYAASTNYDRFLLTVGCVCG